MSGRLTIPIISSSFCLIVVTIIITNLPPQTPPQAFSREAPRRRTPTEARSRGSRTRRDTDLPPRKELKKDKFSFSAFYMFVMAIVVVT